MAKTLPKLASFLRPLGGGSDDLVAVNLGRRLISVAEVRHNSNVINIDNLTSTPLTREVRLNRLQRDLDMVADTLRGMREQGLFSAQDAGLIIPPGIVALRQVTLPFMSPAELARESQDPGFWAEYEPDITKLEDPFVSYHTLLSSENDDMTRVVIGYAEMAVLRPWVDLLLSAHLNPVYLDIEQVAMANYLYASLPPEERRQSQAILHFADDRMEIIAFQPTRFHTIKLEVSDFDQILLAQIETIDQPTGEFWEEVGARVANTLKQSILFLQEEQDFPPFSVVHVATNSGAARNFMTLLDQHFSLAPLALWDPTANAQLAQPVETRLAAVQNRSSLASIFGLGLRRLGTFGETGAGLIRLSMLPQAATLQRNRQLGVVSRSLVKALVLAVVLIGGWTGGIILPAFLESQRQSRGYEGYKLDAEASQQRLATLDARTFALDGELAQLVTISTPKPNMQFLNTIPDLVPEGVELSSYSVDDNSTVMLRGSAANQDAVLLFVTELLNSGLIFGPASSEPIRRPDGGLLDFTITGSLNEES